MVSLLTYAVVKFRKRADDDGLEPAQVYGSNQVEIAWAVIPVLIVGVLFMATTRVIANVQRSVPENAVQVIVVGTAGALLFSACFLYYGGQVAIRRTNAVARRLLLASILYLPLVFVLMAMDKM